MAAKDLAKEFARTFRWAHAFHKHKAPAQTVAPLSRYTNFTLNHIWEQFDCQTHLLLREAMLPTVARNPEVMDADLAHSSFPVKYLSLSKPVHGAFDVPKK
eukprot:GDKI01024266.1.p2 GENE.GDKI01024266.1~~GDKI01024266.1.p2  ORF type:complete len:101 (-),score=25.99 GDKI01024266.1:357-659(-)